MEQLYLKETELENRIHAIVFCQRDENTDDEMKTEAILELGNTFQREG